MDDAPNDNAHTDLHAEQLSSNNIGNCYNSNPPTSGNHNPQPAAFKIYDNASRRRTSSIAGTRGVILWYNTENQQVIDQLKSLSRTN